MTSLFVVLIILAIVIGIIVGSKTKKVRDANYSQWLNQTIKENSEQRQAEEIRFVFFTDPNGEKQLDVMASIQARNYKMKVADLEAEYQSCLEEKIPFKEIVNPEMCDQEMRRRIFNSRSRPLNDVLEEQSNATPTDDEKNKKRLEQLKEHLDSGLITKEEYRARRKVLLKE